MTRPAYVFSLVQFWLGVLASCALLTMPQWASGCALASAIAQVKCPVAYGNQHYLETGTDITRYVVPAKLSKSPLGIPIGPGVDGARIDATFTRVAKCLGMSFNPCGVHAVIIAPDSKVMPNADGVLEQGFPCVKPGPVSAWCTGANQSPATLVLTPDMHMDGWETQRLLCGGDPDKCGRRCWDSIQTWEFPHYDNAVYVRDLAYARALQDWQMDVRAAVARTRPTPVDFYTPPDFQRLDCVNGKWPCVHGDRSWPR